MCVQETTARAGCGEEAGTLLPADPYRSLRVSFGMLLGVDDFETLGAYHRGKTWLHSAWLHREGVVWGLDVRIDPEANEVEVLPGLALDRLGREMHLDVPMCVNVPRWLEEHRNDPELKIETDDLGNVRFEAHVAIRFRACLARPVPALSEPCEGAGHSTSFSRVSETAELLLVAGPAPRPEAWPYHRLRVLFALEPAVLPDDQPVVDERDNILALPAEQRPTAYLAAFRRLAALDSIDLAPPEVEDGEEIPLFPGVEPAPLPLADLVLSLNADRTQLGDDGEVDVTVRPVLVATSTIQELLCGPLWGTADAAPAPPAPLDETTQAESVAPRAGLGETGPRIDPASLAATPKRITFAVDGELHPASLQNASFLVSAFDEDGWSAVAVRGVTLKAGQVTVQLREEPRGRLLRLVVKGTGATPLLGRNLIPLAGALGDPPASAHDGRDFVFQMERRS